MIAAPAAKASHAAAAACTETSKETASMPMMAEKRTISHFRAASDFERPEPYRGKIGRDAAFALAVRETHGRLAVRQAFVVAVQHSLFGSFRAGKA